MKKRFQLLLCFLLPNLLVIAQPVVTSFSPSFGKVGDTILINGTGFGNTASSNIVYFGGAKAFVVTASTTQIVTIVPSGANHRLITVTNNFLTGYSSQKFNVIFSQKGELVIGSFEDPLSFATPDPAGSVLSEDFDGDGKLDMVILNIFESRIAVHRNISSGSIKFDTAKTISIAGQPLDVHAADFNGDGKLDFVSLNRMQSGAGFVKVQKNTSTPGNLLFASDTGYLLSSASLYIRAADLDLDGKPDIVAAIEDTLIVYRNVSTVDSIKFLASAKYNIVGSPNFIEINDMDGDLKPEVMFATSSGIAIYPNVSTQGAIAFGTRLDKEIGVATYADLEIADVDGNGKNDIIALGTGNFSKLYIFRNSSTLNNFVFDSVQYDAGSTSRCLHVTDMDGDSKPDILFAEQSYRITTLKNNSILGSIKFSSAFTFTPNFRLSEVSSGDFDGDGKPDLIYSGTRDQFYICRNKTTEPIISLFTPTIASANSVITINGYNLTEVNDVKFGTQPASSFNIISDKKIQAIIGNGENGFVSISSTSGRDTSAEKLGYNVVSVSSFFPTSGNVRTIITIQGNNFSTIPLDNIVYFGAVRSLVINSTATTLTVEVPPGATYEPISVTVNKRTAYFSRPFVVTFSDGSSISDSTFSAKKDTTTKPSPRAAQIADFNNDGKPDIAVSYISGITFYENVSNPGSEISFNPLLDLYVGEELRDFETADFNSDGKKDLVVGYINAIDIYQNISTTSALRFKSIPWPYFTTSYTIPIDNKAFDIDSDGKPDLAILNVNKLDIHRNISNDSQIVFSEAQTISPVNFLNRLNFADLDSDNKPEMVVISFDSVSIFRNTSVPGVISFDVKKSYFIGGTSQDLVLADLDGDNKPEVCIANTSTNLVSILRNISTPGNINFSPPTTFVTGLSPTSICASDIDGDGKIDLSTTGSLADKVAVFKNLSVPGTITLATAKSFITATNPFTIVSADFNLDTAPELVSVNRGSATISMLRNKLIDSVVVAICPPIGSATITSEIIGSSYQWQLSTGSSFVNISNNINYTGSQSITLQLSNIPSSWHGYRYRCIVNGEYTRTYVLKVRNLWTGLASSLWENPANWACNAIPDQNTDVIINSGSTVINSNVTCGSLTVNSPGSLTVGSGYTLTILR